jgi:hypothetical protein
MIDVTIPSEDVELIKVNNKPRVREDIISSTLSNARNNKMNKYMPIIEWIEKWHNASIDENEETYKVDGDCRYMSCQI